MVKRRADWPEEDELVMCTVKKVFDQGAYLTLDEYDDKEGMVHVSEIASGWVKNIRRHVQEGQKTICRVLGVDSEKRHVDLSIRRVKDSQRSWKSRQWKREKKSDKLLEQVAERVGSDIDTAYEKIGFPLRNKYGEVYEGLEEIAAKGEKEIDWLDLDEEWTSALMELIDSSVEPPSVEVKGYVDLKCPAPNGVGVIKSALTKAENESTEPEVSADIKYIGSPSYSIKVSAPSYKVAEKSLRKISDKAISVVEEEGGTGEFKTEREE
ncbi:MAG: translation initiation factor IF-2 subunit alpha [Hadesarchaea archaeon]|nr:translation initiation factor IF-2 subunit alpha [Hadesarchaea archaeon]